MSCRFVYSVYLYLLLPRFQISLFYLQEKQLFHFRLHRSIFGEFQGVAETDIVLFDVYLVAETQYIAQANAVYDLRWSAAIHLLCKDMIQPLRIIGVQFLHALALV